MATSHHSLICRSLCVAAVGAGLACGAAGQQACGDNVQTSLLGGFWAAGNPTLGEAQPANCSWHYHLGSPGGELLEGTGPVPWSKAGVWGWMPGPDFRPSFGPIAHTDPVVNQLLQYTRPPSFNGMIVRPDVGSDVYAVLEATNPIQISSIAGLCEMLDRNSEGVGLEIFARVSGRTISLMPLKKVTYTPSGSAPLSAVFGTLPLKLGPGDQLVLRATLIGAPQDDWCNVNVTIGFSGGPILLLAPRSVFTTECDQVGLQAIVVGSGPLSYRWQRTAADQPDEYVDVQNGPTPGGSIITGATQSTLRVVGPTNPDRGTYRCVVTGACAQVIAGPADVELCPVDFNCDGIMDASDYVEFEACLEGNCTPGRSADFNGDGFADIYDLSEFVAAFEVGC